jgi:hypothetical protein
MQYSTTLRTNQVGQIQTTVGSSGALKIFSGAEPANCAAADPSGLLATITLPSTFLTSSSGATTIAGTWSTTGSANGTAACFRIYDGSAVCHVQGSVTASGGGGDMIVSTTTIASGGAVSVTTFTVTGNNA